MQKKHDATNDPQHVCDAVFARNAVWKHAGAQLVDGRCMQLLPHHTENEKRDHVASFLSRSHPTSPCILAVNKVAAVELQKLLHESVGVARWYIGAKYVKNSSLYLYVVTCEEKTEFLAL